MKERGRGNEAKRTVRERKGLRKGLVRERRKLVMKDKWINRAKTRLRETGRET